MTRAFTMVTARTVGSMYSDGRHGERIAVFVVATVYPSALSMSLALLFDQKESRS